MKVKTRQKIIAAALHELARDPRASLEHIAASAEVSRITVFRYFPSRQQLLFALYQEATKIFLEVMASLLHEDSSASRKLHKLVEEILPHGATFRFLLYEPIRSDDPRTARLLQDCHKSLHALIRPLIAEGCVSAHLSPLWATRHLASLLWTALDAVDQGELAPTAAPSLIFHTLCHGCGSGGA